MQLVVINQELRYILGLIITIRTHTHTHTPRNDSVPRDSVIGFALCDYIGIFVAVLDFLSFPPAFLPGASGRYGFWCLVCVTLNSPVAVQSHISHGLIKKKKGIFF